MISPNNEWGKCGFITKCGGQFYGQPRRRWFVLDVRGLLLRYYDDAGFESKLLGEIDLTPERCMVIGAVGREKGIYALNLETPARTFELRFDTPEEEDSWWVALMRAQHEAQQRRIEHAGGIREYVQQVRRQASGDEIDRSQSSGPVVSHPQPQTQTLLATAKNAYEQVMNAIIRPPRAEYATADLGPDLFTFIGHQYHRIDAELLNCRGQLLRYSVWERVVDEDDNDLNRNARRPDKRPILVYMHGNASGRLEALATLSLCLSLGIVVAAVDCAGSGMSDGDYVSLGHFEQDDLKAVVAQLRSPPAGSLHRPAGPNVAVWGRSMGAEAGLLWASTRDPSASCLILDSPFSSFEALALDIVAKASPSVPNLASKLVLRWVSSSVRSRANFDLADVDCLRAAPTCRTPALYVAGKNDDFVLPTHAANLYHVHGAHVKCSAVTSGDGAYSLASSALSMFAKVTGSTRSSASGCSSTDAPTNSRDGSFKELLVCDGEHNTQRDLKTYAHIEWFLRCHLLQEDTSVSTCSYAARLNGLQVRATDGSVPNLASLTPWLLQKVLDASGRGEPSYQSTAPDPFGLAARPMPPNPSRSKKSSSAVAAAAVAMASPSSSQQSCANSSEHRAPATTIASDGLVGRADDTFVSGMTATRQRQVEGLVGQLFDSIGGAATPDGKVEANDGDNDEPEQIQDV